MTCRTAGSVRLGFSRVGQDQNETVGVQHETALARGLVFLAQAVFVSA